MHSVGVGLEGVNVEGARGVERVGAGEEFRGVGDAVGVGVEQSGYGVVMMSFPTSPKIEAAASTCRSCE